MIHAQTFIIMTNAIDTTRPPYYMTTLLILIPDALICNHASCALRVVCCDLRIYGDMVDIELIFVLERFKKKLMLEEL